MRYGLLIFFALTFFCAGAQEYYFALGTYDSPKSEGIYVYRFNSGDGTARLTGQVKTANPSFVTFSPDRRFLFAVEETASPDGRGGAVSAFAFNKDDGTLRLISRQRSGGDHPCHVETDKTGRWLFVSNYSGGSLAVLPVMKDGSLGTAALYRMEGSGKNPVRQKGPHVHGAFIAPGNKQLFVTDLGTDKLMIYSFDDQNGKLIPGNPAFITSVPGSGPRSLAFHPSARFTYLLEELSGTVTAFRYRKGKLMRRQRIRTQATGDTLFAGSAAIQVSPDGKFLYASNRGEVNTIAVFRIKNATGRLRPLAYLPVKGRTPRHFSIDPTGQYLLSENQNSDEIVIFRRDKKTGLLTETGNRIPAGRPVCIRWAAD